MSRTISHTRHTISAVLITCGLALTTGCLEEDVVSPALKSAAEQLEALGAPGSSVPGDEFRLGEYRAAIATLQEVATSGTKVQNAEAALMIARAQVGLAEPSAISLNDLNEQLYAAAAELRSEHAEWATLCSLAETAEAFDPSADQALYNEKIQERDAAIAAEQTKVEAVKVRVAELEQLAKQAITSAGELRIREEQHRNNAGKLSAQEALPLHEQAAAFRREADKFEVNAEMQMVIADTIRPEINDHEVEINRLTRQRNLLVANSQDVASKAVEGRNEAKDLREQAQQTAQRIDKVVSRIEKLRTGEAMSAFDAMNQAYDTAASSAGKASSGNRSGSSLAKGEIRQAQGVLTGSHASTLGFVASILNQVAETRTPLPNAGTIAATSASMQADAEAHNTSALETFIEARDAFENASLRGDASDRIDSVVTELNRVIESLGGESAEPVEAFDGAAGDGFVDDGELIEDAQIDEGLDDDGND